MNRKKCIFRNKSNIFSKYRKQYYDEEKNECDAHWCLSTSLYYNNTLNRKSTEPKKKYSKCKIVLRISCNLIIANYIEPNLNIDIQSMIRYKMVLFHLFGFQVKICCRSSYIESHRITHIGIIYVIIILDVTINMRCKEAKREKGNFYRLYK